MKQSTLKTLALSFFIEMGWVGALAQVNNTEMAMPDFGDHCTSILVGKNATTDGSVITSHTCDSWYRTWMQWIPSVGQKCLELNPNIKCTDPQYEFCEYLDGEYKETDIRIRHNEAVTAFGKENELIRFKTLPAAKVLSIYHKGAYDKIGEAYAFLMKYAEQNGYTAAGLARECYIDGIWNKESEEDWLTEIQLPIE